MVFEVHLPNESTVGDPDPVVTKVMVMVMVMVVVVDHAGGRHAAAGDDGGWLCHAADADGDGGDGGQGRGEGGEGRLCLSIVI